MYLGCFSLHSSFIKSMCEIWCKTQQKIERKTQWLKIRKWIMSNLSQGILLPIKLHVTCSREHETRPSVSAMLVQRLRRWPSIAETLCRGFVSAGVGAKASFQPTNGALFTWPADRNVVCSVLWEIASWPFRFDPAGNALGLTRRQIVYQCWLDAGRVGSTCQQHWWKVGHISHSTGTRQRQQDKSKADSFVSVWSTSSTSRVVRVSAAAAWFNPQHLQRRNILYKPWRPKGFSIWNHHRRLTKLFPLHLNTYMYVTSLWPS